MAKRNNDESEFIKASSNLGKEGLMATAILNALKLWDNTKEFIPRKDLTKLLKKTTLNLVFKALEDVHNIAVREVSDISQVGSVGIMLFPHPNNILGYIPCTIDRIGETQYRLINSPFTDEIQIEVEEDFLAHYFSKATYYQIFLKSGNDKKIIDKDCNNSNCESCIRMKIDSYKAASGSVVVDQLCLYDNTEIENAYQCCDKYTSIKYKEN